jgi:hypothetical protein
MNLIRGITEDGFYILGKIYVVEPPSCHLTIR